MLRLNFKGWRVLCLLVAASVPGFASAGPLPIEAFFATDTIRQMALSPDGTKIAVLSPVNDRYSISVIEVATGQTKIVKRMNDENIRGMNWEGNDRIGFSALARGFEVPFYGITDLEGKHRRILEPQQGEDQINPFQGNVFDYLPLAKDDGYFLILGFTGESDASRVESLRGGRFTPAIYRVNARTGTRSLVSSVTDRISFDLADNDGQLRFGTEVFKGERTLYHRANNQSPWKKIGVFPPLGGGVVPLRFLADNRTCYVLDARTNDRPVLRALDTVSLEFGPVLFEPAVGEIETIILSPARDRLLGVVYNDDRRRVQWLDAGYAKLMAMLDASLPGAVNQIVSMSRDENRLLIQSESDRNPGSFFFMDRKAGKIQPLGARMSGIDPKQMSPMEPITFKARDGMEIHGYLTIPLGDKSRRWPLVVNPHGGPFGIRDEWGFNPEVQFLASRGLAVLQVNYRGSGGYGDSYQRAGYREWGGKMQDDLTDGVLWAVEKGYADKERVAIYGASYGGYAALAGVTFTPELYRCAINYVGVSDLRLLTRWDQRKGYGMENFMEEAIGRDREELGRRSPVNFVERIRVPTLHAYGENDPRVKIENWELLEAQLKKFGKSYEFLRLENEGHGFDKTANKLAFYGALERFLTRNLQLDGAARVEVGAPHVTEIPAKN